MFFRNSRRDDILIDALGHAEFLRNMVAARAVAQMDDERIGHLARLLCESVDELLDASDVIVVGNSAPEFADALTRTRPSQIVLDLVRVPADRSRVAAAYRGLCW